jgi:hypothetical protein
MIIVDGCVVCVYISFICNLAVCPSFSITESIPLVALVALSLLT